MIAVSQLGFINTVRQTVDGLLPGGYWAEAKYLVDRIVAAPGVPDIEGMGDIVPIGSMNAPQSSKADLLLLDLDTSYLDEPLVPAKEMTRVAQLCRSARIKLIHI